MILVRRLIATLLMALIVSVLLGGTTYVAQRYLPVPPTSATPTPLPPKALNMTAVEKILDLLQSHYIHPVNERKLVEAGIKELKEFLKEKKLDPNTVAALPAELKERKQLLSGLESAIQQAKATAKDKASEQKLMYASIRGLLAGLDDPYCVVFEPSEYKHFEEQMNGGNFGGIGVYIELDKKHGNRLTIVEPIEGTPAYQAGLKQGDYIARIDGKETKGWDIETAASKIRGPEGSTVMLTVIRPPETTPRQIPVKRAVIHVRSVSFKMLENNVGYIRIRLFGEETSEEFDEELEKAQKKGAQALIIDLRNNGGGYVNAAIEICSHFVEKGKTVVSVVNSRTERHDSHGAVGNEVVKMPVVVLVNRFSASASEITAGCLKDHKVAKLVGETTFGKASVQQIERLNDGGAFKYTVAHYLTPSGRDIHRRGIEVDVSVKVSAKDETDLALEAAQKLLKEQLAAGK